MIRPRLALLILGLGLLANTPVRAGAELVLTSSLAGEASRSSSVLLSGTRWETGIIEIDSGQPGPILMLVGGVHGNEPAGNGAAQHIAANWAPDRGRLLIVPRANEPGLRARQRRMPGLPRVESDLNRQFPMSPDAQPKGELASAIWDLVQEVMPDLLLDLHEGYDFAQINPRSVGSTLLTDRSERTQILACAMAAVLNQTIPDPEKHFVIKLPMVAHSLARASFEVLGIPSMILETTTKGQGLDLRIRQHLIMVHAAMHELGMLDRCLLTTDGYFVETEAFTAE